MPILGIMASQISGHLFAPSGAYDSIATVTVGGGGTGEVNFTSIPATFTHLQVRTNHTMSAANAGCNVRVGNGTIDAGSNYTLHALYGGGATAGATAGASQAQINLYFVTGNATTAQAEVEIIDILDYANTSKYKTMRVLGGVDNNGSGEVFLASGVWMSTSAIDAIRIRTSSGSFNEYSSFALYGIKGA